MFPPVVTLHMPRKAENHIRVTDETWSRLNKRKRPGDSFDDVIQRLLEQTEEAGEENPNPNAPQTAD